MRGGGWNGFMAAATHIPQAHEDFVRLAVLELQKVSILREDYDESNIREGLGLRAFGT